MQTLQSLSEPVFCNSHFLPETRPIPSKNHQQVVDHNFRVVQAPETPSFCFP